MLTRAWDDALHERQHGMGSLPLPYDAQTVRNPFGSQLLQQASSAQVHSTRALLLSQREVSLCLLCPLFLPCALPPSLLAWPHRH